MRIVHFVTKTKTQSRCGIDVSKLPATAALRWVTCKNCLRTKVWRKFDKLLRNGWK